MPRKSKARHSKAKRSKARRSKTRRSKARRRKAGRSKVRRSKVRRKSLYSANKSRKTSGGTGYKNKQKAKNTIKALKNQPKKRQIWTINTLYYRAKYHPYQTDDMCDAMKIFEAWLDDNVGTCPSGHCSKARRSKMKRSSRVKRKSKASKKRSSRVKRKSKVSKPKEGN